MAATDIRLIVLATVWHLEPATGYAVRKHLIEQGIEVWGGVSVASIYSALNTLTKHGRLEEIGDPTGIRANTKAYRTTESGRREFHALWQSAIETVDPAHPLAFHVAITLTAFVTKASYVSALRRRLNTLEHGVSVPAPPEVPAQTRNAARLWRQLASTEAEWVRQTIELTERPDDGLGFATTKPPPEPGHRDVSRSDS
jgi:DNA-binding PadR family transcriptional regulator